jgi:hypothetical protein
MSIALPYRFMLAAILFAVLGHGRSGHLDGQ